MSIVDADLRVRGWRPIDTRAEIEYVARQTNVLWRCLSHTDVGHAYACHHQLLKQYIMTWIHTVCKFSAQVTYWDAIVILTILCQYLMRQANLNFDAKNCKQFS